MRVKLSVLMGRLRLSSNRSLCISSLVWLLGGLLAPVGVQAAATQPTPEESTVTMSIQSPAFEAGGEIPQRFTCDGDDVSPPLVWSGVPEGARSLVLIVDDPDAPDPEHPRMTWVHWVLYDLPPSCTGLPEAVATKDLPEGTREGRNDWKRTGYGGPCPPIGRHRYFHKLYALDTVLPDLEQPTKAQLLEAMEGHVLAQAELVGTYARSR